MPKRVELTFRGHPAEVTPSDLATIVASLRSSEDSELVLTFHYPRATEDDARGDLPGLMQKLSAHDPSLKSEATLTYMSGPRNTNDDYARFLLRRMTTL